MCADSRIFQPIQIEKVIEDKENKERFRFFTPEGVKKYERGEDDG